MSHLKSVCVVIDEFLLVVNQDAASVQKKTEHFRQKIGNRRQIEAHRELKNPVEQDLKFVFTIIAGKQNMCIL